MKDRQVATLIGQFCMFGYHHIVLNYMETSDSYDYWMREETFCF